MTERTSTED